MKVSKDARVLEARLERNLRTIRNLVLDVPTAEVGSTEIELNTGVGTRNGVDENAVPQSSPNRPQDRPVLKGIRVEPDVDVNEIVWPVKPSIDTSSTRFGISTYGTSPLPARPAAPVSFSLSQYGDRNEDVIRTMKVLRRSRFHPHNTEAALQQQLGAGDVEVAVEKFGSGVFTPIGSGAALRSSIEEVSHLHSEIISRLAFYTIMLLCLLQNSVQVCVLILFYL